MRHVYSIVILSLLLSLCLVSITQIKVSASPKPQDEVPIFIYFFWSDGCPHCAEAKPFLEDLSLRYPNLVVESFEVWYDADNQALFQQVAKAHGFEPRYVPTIFIGERYWEGFSEGLQQEIESAIQTCADTGCIDAGSGIVPGHESQPLVVLSPPPVFDVNRPLQIYLFWGEDCLQCEASPHLEGKANDYPLFGSQGNQEVRPFLRSLEQQYPQVQVHIYEVWYAPHNQKRFDEMAAAFSFEPRGVPTIFFGERYWEGYDRVIQAEIESYVQICLASECTDIGSSVLAPQVTPTETPVTNGAIDLTPIQFSAPQIKDTVIIKVPLFGEVNLNAQSLWVSTVIISFVDGFNPCSLWVLSILIALSLRTGSRKKIFFIGLTFITVTALVYVLFIAGLFTMLTFVRFIGWIQIAVSVLALFFAGINIKDYFLYKQGLSFTIDDAQKPGLYKRMRRVLQAGDSLGALLAATVGLGFGVSLIEFSCTAGFPVLWTNMVAGQNVKPFTFVMLLLLYMVIYQIDEMGIFLIAVVTLHASKLEEKHGRILKLIGGTLMLTLSIVMVIKPAWMNEVLSSLLIFAAAFGVAGLVLLVHRIILPKFGIFVGSEQGIKPRN